VDGVGDDCCTCEEPASEAGSGTDGVDDKIMALVGPMSVI